MMAGRDMRGVVLMTAWLACALLAAAQTAAAEPVADGIGIYCAPDGFESCCFSATPYFVRSFYVVASNLSEPSGIACWEAKILYDPAAWPAGITWSVRGEGAVFAPEDAPVFRVCIPAGIARTPAMTLLTISTFYLGGVLELGLGPTDPSMVGGAGPAYAPVGAPTSWKAFQVLLGRWLSSWPWPGEPGGFGAAMIGTLSCHVRDIDASSWGAIKSLYD